MLSVYLIIVIYTRFCLSLYIAKGSPCSPQCNITGGTYWTDLVCSDDDFMSTPRGQTLNTCLDCIVDSTYINSSYTDGNSDQYWTLFHMKYVQDYCLTTDTTPHIAAVNACVSTCSPLSTVLNMLWINSHPYRPMYDYCTADSGSYTSNAEACASCLHSQKGGVIIGNFIDTMVNACVNKPYAANGQLIVPKRNLFETATIPLSSSAVATSSVHSTRVATSSSASSVTASSGPLDAGESSKTRSGLSTGAAAGIGAVGALLLLGIVGAIAWFFIRRCRQARTREQQPLALELRESQERYKDHGINFGSTLVEKSAHDQIYEAPNGSETVLIELPGSTSLQKHKI